MFATILTNEIKVVHEDHTLDGRDADFKLAEIMLVQSRRVYLLGFGFGTRNVQRIKLDTLTPDAFSGTAYGLTDKERNDCCGLAGGRVRLFRETCLSFMRQYVELIDGSQKMTEYVPEENDPEETYLAIGHFIKRFSSIEWTLRYYLPQAVGLDMKYMDVIITHDFALLCTAVSTVYSELLKTDQERKRLKKLIGQCRAMNDIRIKVVHGLNWFADFDGGTLAHVSRSTLRQQDTTGMTEKLEKAAQDGAGLFCELQDLLSSVLEEDYGKG